jgi:GNAT superfamily N-acetyltransferase
MMNLDDITIRTNLHPGDIGWIIHRHGRYYGEEYSYGLSFEAYVAQGMYEFYTNYNPELDRVWICEHRNETVGFLLLMHRERDAAQLRYFFLEPECRGMGLGKKLIDLYMDFLIGKGYRSSYLWTTDELHAAASLYKSRGFKLSEERESTAFGKALKEQRYDWVRG